MPPAPAPSLDLSHALKVAVQGFLLADATVRQRSNGAVVIDLIVAQQVEHRPEARPLSASLPIPGSSFASAFAKAQAKAASLTAGTAVIVVGQGVEAGHRHGRAVFRFLTTVGAVRADEIPNQEPIHAH